MPQEIIDIITKIQELPIYEWIMTFCPIEFFGHSIPLIPLAIVVVILGLIIKGTVKAIIKVGVAAGVIYLISFALEYFGVM